MDYDVWMDDVCKLNFRDAVQASTHQVAVQAQEL